MKAYEQAQEDFIHAMIDDDDQAAVAAVKALEQTERRLCVSLVVSECLDRLDSHKPDWRPEQPITKIYLSKIA